MSPQFAILSSYGQRRSYKAGELLFREGDRHVPMFVLRSGRVAPPPELQQRLLVDNPMRLYWPEEVGK